MSQTLPPARQYPRWMCRMNISCMFLLALSFRRSTDPVGPQGQCGTHSTWRLILGRPKQTSHYGPNHRPSPLRVWLAIGLFRTFLPHPR
ncbi:hypothetical protein M378DRAFT_727772 [Amanita muscaria Koide BX008]|uniref:Secreted protein n=1 Tax=Amanita muscaria (strain Koide BX008) TaxID=946122 RepID=A0A0C2W134_AMAMK|nr:hypothetical protein M378DRAFT_727772 [Amanita muscaria Koide BX008]